MDTLTTHIARPGFMEEEAQFTKPKGGGAEGHSCRA